MTRLPPLTIAMLATLISPVVPPRVVLPEGVKQ